MLLNSRSADKPLSYRATDLSIAFGITRKSYTITMKNIVFTAFLLLLVFDLILTCCLQDVWNFSKVYMLYE